MTWHIYCPKHSTIEEDWLKLRRLIFLAGLGRAEKRIG